MLEFRSSQTRRPAIAYTLRGPTMRLFSAKGRQQYLSNDDRASPQNHDTLDVLSLLNCCSCRPSLKGWHAAILHLFRSSDNSAGPQLPAATMRGQTPGRMQWATQRQSGMADGAQRATSNEGCPRSQTASQLHIRHYAEMTTGAHSCRTVQLPLTCRGDFGPLDDLQVRCKLRNQPF